MSTTPPRNINLAFSDKYGRDHAQAYFRKHHDGLSRRLSHWRDVQVARRALALAGEPQLVLDLPCGAGRFWPLLAEHPKREIIAADNSPDMLAVARRMQAPALVDRVRTMQTSAFDIDLPPASVDCVFCMRLLHHIGEHDHRMRMLRELHRVSRDTAIVSLWVDGNFKAWRRKRLESDRARRERRGYQNRFVLPVDAAEREFAEAGFDVVGKLDFLPYYAMWRTYVLRKSAA